MFELRGQLMAGGATGEISTSGGAGFFALGHVDGQLQLIVAEVDPSTRQPDLADGWSMAFLPVAGGGPFADAQRDGGGARPPSGDPMPGADQSSTQRDPSLVGHWTYTERYSSGDFSANTTFQMLVNADGTYQYGAGNVSLGGNYQGNTGNSGNVTSGQWRTGGGVVHIMEQGSGQWIPYAQYCVEGASK